MSKAPRLAKVVTPPGIAQYPHLAEPDEYKGNIQYKTNLILDPNEEGVSAFLEKVEEACQKAYDDTIAKWTEELDSATGKKKADLKKNIGSLEVHKPWEPEYDDEGEETGRVVVKFKCQAEGEYKSGKNKGKKWTRDLPIFDSQKNVLDPEGLKLWGGSIIRVQAEMNPYGMAAIDKAGVSLRLFAVQVIELSNGGGDAADGFGIEDGYVGTQKAPAEAPSAPAEEDDVDEDEDF